MTDVGWAEHYATEAGARYWPNEELVRWISWRGFKRSLDAGCGTGSNVRLLREHADRVVAIDFRPEPRKALFGVGNVEVHDADIRSLPFDDATFDLVVDCMTSQHIPWAEHGAVYAEYARVLEPGGWLWLLHLDSGTKATEWSPGEGLFDDTYLSLFPTLRMFCLPPPQMLMAKVHKRDFTIEETRGLAREYPDGQVAHYTIIAARKT